MAESIKFWLAYFVLVGAIVVLGWRQPLSYRFMSKQEISALENPPTPTPTPTPAFWETRHRTKLDEGAYRDRGLGPR